LCIAKKLTINIYSMFADIIFGWITVILLFLTCYAVSLCLSNIEERTAIREYNKLFKSNMDTFNRRKTSSSDFKVDEKANSTTSENVHIRLNPGKNLDSEGFPSGSDGELPGGKSRGQSRGGGGPRGRTRTLDGLFEPLMLPIRHLSVDNLCYPCLCREHLVKNQTLFTPRSDDVIVMTYPRSGTTWTLEITRQIHLAHSPDLAAGHPLMSPDHKISAPWINNHNNMAARNLDSDPSPRVMKSHNHYRHINLLPSDSDTKIIHVMRDPKDVLCSMYHHVLQAGPICSTFREHFPSLCSTSWPVR